MPTGRKTKYTHETVTRIVNALNVGMTDANACSIAGIGETTFYHWKETKAEFRDRVTRAREEGWMSDLAIIKRAAIDGDWRAAGDHLDRTKSPYRRSQETQVTGADGSPITITIVGRPDGPE